MKLTKTRIVVAVLASILFGVLASQGVTVEASDQKRVIEAVMLLLSLLQ